VEFLAVCMPLLLLFMGTTEMAFFYASKLLTQYAANRAVRAAVVILPEDPIFFASAGDRMDRISLAAQIALGEAAAGPGQSPYVRVEVCTAAACPIPDPSWVGRDESVRVTVQYDHPCRVALVDRLLCSATPGSRYLRRTIEAQASLPNQGADYAYRSAAQ
jgi:hypothetical protein